MAYVLGFLFMLAGYSLAYIALASWFPDYGVIPTMAV